MNKGDNIIFLYTLQNCIYCNEFKGRLKKLEIPYKEIIIDDGSIYNSLLGDNLEKKYKTENYPIIEIKNKYLKKAFITKTDLEEQNNIYIFDDIEQLIEQIKKNEI